MPKNEGSLMVYTTIADAENAVVDAIEAAGSPVKDARAEFDVGAITSEVYEYRPDAQEFVQVVSVDEFWTIVEKHAR